MAGILVLIVVMGTTLGLVSVVSRLKYKILRFERVRCALVTLSGNIDSCVTKSI